MPDLARLEGQHRAINRLADSLEARAGQVRDLDSAYLASATLEALDRVLAQHIAEEEVEIYDRLKTSRDVSAQAASDEHRDALAGLCQYWRDYRAEWPQTRIVAEATAFAAMTAQVLNAVRRHVALEESELYARLRPQHAGLA